MNRDNTVLQWLLYCFLPNRNLSTHRGYCAGVVYFWFLPILPVLVCSGDGLSAAVQSVASLCAVQERNS